MCGICGIINLNKEPVDPQTLHQMASTQRHRGPDDEGYLFAPLNREGGMILAGGPDTPTAVYESQLPFCPKQSVDTLAPSSGLHIGLANRRLSILDLSPAGHQPLCNEDGSVWVVHNGEIYNYPDLKQELSRRGHTFASNTDTEVIVHAYEEWGESCLDRFNGMWAFCLLDRRQGKLFLSRDRFGIKPFYYFLDGKTLLFSSEIKGLLTRGLVRPRPDEEALQAYLTVHLTNYNHRTFFREVQELLPGHFLQIDLKSGAHLIRQYYRVPTETIRSDDREAIAEFGQIFRDSVKRRLISDVPLGTCLSGGMDSSSIVCSLDRLMREEGIKLPGSDIQKTFSARYEDARHDEGQYIQRVTDSAETEAHFTFPSVDDLLEEVTRLIWHQEEPFGTTSIYAQWCVFRLARQQDVKVTLDGQGGDELLAGYTDYRHPFLAQLLRQGSWAAYRRELRAFTQSGESATRLIRRSIRESLSPRFRRATSRLFRSDRFDVPVDASIRNPLVRILDRDFSNSLTNLLRYEDRNSMAHSIETRLPFMDYRLVELCFRLPAEMKIRDGLTKWILRESMTGILPEEVRMRKDKVGFSTPEDTWFRNGLRRFAEDILASESFRSRPHVDPDMARKDLDRHLAGIKNRSEALWRILNLELWLRTFIDPTESYHR